MGFIQSIWTYIVSLGIWGWLLMGLSLFTALGAFEFFTHIPALRNFPAWGWLLVLIIALLLAPYWAYKKQDEEIAILSLKLKPSEAVHTIFTIEGEEAEFGEPGKGGYPYVYTKRVLRISVLIHAIPTKWVKSVELAIANHVIMSNWQPDYVSSGAPTGGYFYFSIPDSIREGKHFVKLRASALDITTESSHIEIEVPKCS